MEIVSAPLLVKGAGSQTPLRVAKSPERQILRRPATSRSATSRAATCVLMKDAHTPDVLDASMIADAQAVEHYEIARYGTLIAWARQLGLNDAAGLLQQTLEQEYMPIRSSLSWRRRSSIVRRLEH